VYLFLLSQFHNHFVNYIAIHFANGELEFYK